MRQLLLLLSFFLSIGWVSAQEIPSDSIRRAPTSNMKNIGGFLLDMGLMTNAPSLPKYNLSVPDASKDYNQIFRLNNDITYSQGYADGFGQPFSYGYGWGISNPAPYMQMGSFKLNNGWRMNTYGDYNQDGWRVPNRSAMPWEKNNFRGAFELKSPNGNFGFRIEVQQGRNGLY